MEWTHIACMLAGTFVGSFLMTVWRNERRHRLEKECRRAVLRRKILDKAVMAGLIDRP